MYGGNGTLTGWRDPPNERGTFEILKICTLTVFLLCWSSVCTNLTSPRRGYWARFGTKLQLFLLAVLGPDFVLTLALGQCNAAYRSKQAFKRGNYEGWTLRHCFFINMGGVHLEFPDRQVAGESTFPVDCDQLLWLASRNYICLPAISTDDVNDRNKADSLARLIAVVQSLWFTADSLGRVGQGLAISTMELTTLSFVFLMTFCSAFWWRKPMDISRPLVIPVNVPLSTILRESDAPEPLRGRTPLAWVNREEWPISLAWTYFTQILWKMHVVPGQQLPAAQGDYFQSIDFPYIELRWEVVGGSLITLYSGIFMAAWNFTFPSRIEQILWRISSIFTLAYGIIGEVVIAWFHHSSKVSNGWSKVRQWMSQSLACHDCPDHLAGISGDHSPGGKLSDTLHYLRHSFYRWTDHMRNISPDRDPALAIPLRWNVWLLALSALYCFARLFILVEDIIGLRALPPSSYQVVDYGPYSPIS